MKDNDVKVFDVLKEFEDNLKNGSKKSKKKLSIISEFKDLIEESFAIEEEEERRSLRKKELEDAYELYARRTKDKRRGRGKTLKKAVLDSVSGAIINSTPTNITVNGSNFQSEIGQLAVVFGFGGVTAEVFVEANISGTQASASVPASIYGLSPGSVVQVSVQPGNLQELESSESVTTTVLAPCPGGG